MNQEQTRSSIEPEQPLQVSSPGRAWTASQDNRAESRRSAMLRRFGILFHLLGLGLLLDRLRLSDPSVDRIRRAMEDGPVVYVLHTRSLMDWLALNVVLNVRRLPLATCTARIRITPFLPLPEMFSALRDQILRRIRGSSDDIVDSGRLARMVAMGQNACVFLQDRPSFLGRLLGIQPSDPVAALLEAQAHSERPIQLIPVVIIWDRSPPTARSGVGRLVLGDDEWPGDWKKIRYLLTRRHDSLVQVGDPLHLSRFLDRYPDEPPLRRTRLLRVALRHFLYKEQALVRGPRLHSHAWMRRTVLDSAPIRELVINEARATGQPVERVRQAVGVAFDRIAARMSFTWMLIGHRVTDFLWNRIYGGVDIGEGDLDRIREALRKGTPILVPSHRSHLDYLLLSSLLYNHDVVIPHVIAGINLSFWPAGPVLRRLGAVFIKRSFKGDRIFPAVFTRYLQQLIREGYPVEFFIEGGRSRTGKVLEPRFGVLGMVMEAAEQVCTEDFDVTFLPMNITYEQVAEEREYSQELKGGKKEAESFWDLLRIRRVLRHRYGRVYLRVGQPISAREIVHAPSGSWSSITESERRDRLGTLGRRLLSRVNDRAVVPPTSLVAAALLAHDRRGIRRGLLEQRAERFLAFLAHEGVELAATLSRPRWAVDEAVRRFVAGRKVGVFWDESGPIYRLAEENRNILEFYKNNIIHCFVPASLLAMCIHGRADRRSGPNPTFDPQAASTDFLRLAHLFRHEFVFDPDIPLPTVRDKALASLLHCGALRAEGKQVGDIVILEELAALTTNFVESYWLTLKATHALRLKELDEATILGEIRHIGEGLYAVGEINRPEALSALNLKNAFQTLKEDGVLRFRSTGMGLDFDEAAFQDLQRFLASLLE